MLPESAMTSSPIASADRHPQSDLTAARPSARPIGIWLLAVAALVFAMVVLGGVTRLTQSGLSMVEWQPLIGWLPPTSEQAWLGTFEKYTQFPEYQKKNFGMTLAEFKGIFWLEYFHRLLGRAIGPNLKCQDHKCCRPMHPVQ